MKLPLAVFAMPLLLAAQPDAREIVKKSIQVDNLNAERARNYTMTQRTIERTLDSAGKVKETESKTVEVLMIHGEPYRKLVARNDKPLSPDEQRKEEEKMQRASVNREKVTEAERARKRLKQREFMQEIPEAYDFRFVREEKVAGRDTWVVEGTPRPDYKPKVQNAGFLSKFRGTLWIDKVDYQWVKADCESIEPVSIGLFLARLSKGAHISFEQTRVNNEVWLPNRMTLRFDARLALVAHKIAEIEQTTSNYKKYQAESRITGVVEKQSP